VAGGAPYGWSIKAALDAGADGVIVPQVRTVDEVRSIVSDCRYPTGPNRQPPYDRKQTGPSTHLDYRKRGMGHSECWLATVPSHVGLKQPHMAMLLDFAAVIPSNYFREPFYKYTAEAAHELWHACEATCVYSVQHTNVQTSPRQAMCRFTDVPRCWFGLLSHPRCRHLQCRSLSRVCCYADLGPSPIAAHSPSPGSPQRAASRLGPRQHTDTPRVASNG
jgi:hypothetical protein